MKKIDIPEDQVMVIDLIHGSRLSATHEESVFIDDVFIKIKRIFIYTDENHNETYHDEWIWIPISNIRRVDI